MRGADGRLVFVRLAVPPRNLEEVLELLAGASFPLNPEIRHSVSVTVVEFPAYDTHVSEVRELLRASGLENVEIEIANALTAIQ